MSESSIWIELLKNVGFPIMIASYLLFSFERKIEKLSETVTKLESDMQNNKE